MSENNTIVKEKGLDDGQITYANEVIATIVSVATTEVDGISGIAGAAGSITGILGKGSKTPRGVKVDVNGNDINVDVSVTVDYGMPIQKVGRNAQENVRKSIESMTGLHVDKVDLHVVGVSFEKENQELQQSQKLALTIEEERPAAEEVAQEAAEEVEEVEEVQAEVIFTEEEKTEAEDDEEENEDTETQEQ